MLRYRKLWISIGWLLVLTVCYLTLSSNPPDFYLTFEYSDKLKHLFAYFVLMVWFAQIYKTKESRFVFITFFILMGISLEVVQGLGQTRFFEYSDMLANSLGVLTAWITTKGNAKDVLLIIENKYLS